MVSTKTLIVLAAGGTGGHVFPAESLARELLGRGYDVALITDTRGGKFNDELAIPTYRIQASALGKSFVGKVQSILKMGFGVLQASLRLRRLRPAAVVGFGGYPSVPTLYAAYRLNIPIILHEQNAILGRANRALMDVAKVIATSFPQVSGLKTGPETRLVQTGNPVRPAFLAGRAKPYPPVSDTSPFRILVVGGSLGAKVLSDVVPRALGLLPIHLKRRIVLAQQCRKDDLEQTRAALAGAGVEAELASFFTDIPDRMADAHLVICRSGGSTIAELSAIGRPSILVPYPHGHAGEQTANAAALAEAGGAWLIPEASLTPEALAVRLESLMALPEALSKSATAARAFGRISAADQLASLVEEVIASHPIKKSSGTPGTPPSSLNRENAA